MTTAVTASVTVITKALIRELTARHGEPTITSVYLDVDGRHRTTPGTYQAAFEALADAVRRRAKKTGDDDLVRAIDADLDRMRAWLAQPLDRRATRGVALFACTAEHFFQAVALPRRVRDEAGLGPTPRVSQLIGLLDEYEPFVVALIDRRHLRLLRFDLGEVSELAGLDEPAPRAIDVHVALGSFDNYDDEVIAAHWRRSADTVTAVLDPWPTDRLIVGGPDEAVAGLAEHLPPRVAKRIVGRVSVRVAAPTKEITNAVLEVQEAAERHADAEQVEQLRERSASGRSGVVGLRATLEALADARVETLLVSEGFHMPGNVCPSCGQLGIDSGPCCRCETATVEIDDVVEAAVNEAVGQHATVEFFRDRTLELLGNIGALARF